MCHLRNIAICDYQESVTTGQTPDKVIPMCRYASQTTQKDFLKAITGNTVHQGKFCHFISIILTLWSTCS